MPRKKPARKAPHPTQHHPVLSWKLVLGAIAGVSAVYVAVVATGHGAIFASDQPLFCPASKTMKATECASGDCKAMPECTGKQCGASCPGNCGKRTA